MTAIPGTSAAWRFAHALFNETLYEEIPPPERAELHGCVGAAMEETLDAEEHLAELAYHFGASQQKDDARRALSYARRAGDRALRCSPTRRRRGSMRWPSARSSGRRRWTSRPAASSSSLGEAHKRAGSADDAKRAFLRAADVGRAVGLPELLTRAALGFAPTVFWAEAPLPDETRTRLLEEAISTWGNDESALRARVMARLALDLHFWDPLGRTSELCEQAVATARRIGDPSALAFASAAARGRTRTGRRA